MNQDQEPAVDVQEGEILIKMLVQVLVLSYYQD